MQTNTDQTPATAIESEPFARLGRWLDMFDEVFDINQPKNEEK